MTAPGVEVKLAQFVYNRYVTSQSQEKLNVEFDTAAPASSIQNTTEVQINNSLFKSLTLSPKKAIVILEESMICVPKLSITLSEQVMLL